MSSQAAALAATPRVALALLLEAPPRGIHPPPKFHGAQKFLWPSVPKYARGGAAEGEVVHTADPKKSPERTKTLTRRTCITRHKLCL